MSSQEGLIPLSPDGLYPVPGDYIDVQMDSMDGPSHALENDGKFLYTSSLATCIGIAISGVYPSDKPSPPRKKGYDRFMIHTSELMEAENYAALREEVEAAKAKGLQDLEAHVTACDPVSNTSQAEVVSSSETQKSLKERLRELVGSDDRIHWYPYQFDPSYDASMALFSDLTVIVEQGTLGDPGQPPSRWRLDEKK
ncbi:hypothetical protein PG993_005729 [Apiospora rasikravindrae]|uniref:Uncharacterized protein n=1 Tax=Apiospora rasikravindrae TaxID=990691 RepID=A0ABR1T9L7_9PEZI